MTHLHSWQPIPGECGQYACSDCPATGYRANSGEIREHKQKKQHAKQWTARSRGYQDGRVEPIDPEKDYEGWVDQPVTLHTGAVRPEELCPGCDKVRMLALEYFATQVEARAR